VRVVCCAQMHLARAYCSPPICHLDGSKLSNVEERKVESRPHTHRTGPADNSRQARDQLQLQVQGEAEGDFKNGRLILSKPASGKSPKNHVDYLIKTKSNQTRIKEAWQVESAEE
jgi:hypothetical protein